MGEVLFEVGPGERVVPVPGAAGRGRRGQPGKRFRKFDPAQPLLMSPVLDEWLPEEHLARFVADLVDDVLDLGAVYDSYTEARGFPPHDPRLMVRLLVYGYCTGVRSSRAIERRCVDDVAFRYLSAGQAPDFRSIAKFRRRHLDALAGLLLQSLRLAQSVGMVRLGRVALDGTKLRAAASKHKAMSYDRLVEREAHLEAEIAELEGQIAGMLAEAETVDTAEDARLGPDRRDDDLPASWPGGRPGWPSCKRPGPVWRPRRGRGPRPKPRCGAAPTGLGRSATSGRSPMPGGPRRSGRGPTGRRSATSPTRTAGS